MMREGMYGNGHTLKDVSYYVTLVCRAVVLRAIKAPESVKRGRKTTAIK